MFLRPNDHGPRARGFTLIETLVTLAIVGFLMIGLYTLLDSSGKIAKQETNVADAQAASRQGIYEVSRIIRQARVGQLYYGNAIIPANNIGSSFTLTDLSNATHTGRQGTDAIDVRGVIFDQIYFFNSDAIAGTFSSLTVTLKPQAASGVTNFTTAGKPAFASRTTPFYFMIATTESNAVAVGASSYLNTLYYVGLVDPSANPDFANAPATPGQFSFVMDCTASGARKYYPSTTALPTTLQRPFAGGPIDEVIFYVDRGSADPNVTPVQYTHPYLAQATFDPATDKYNIQPLVEEVEDFQVAYGIDGIDASTRDLAVSPSAAKISSTGNTDEWVYDTSGDNNLATSSPPFVVSDFIDPSVPGGADHFARPALRSILLGVVVKSTEPETDSTINLAGGKGIKLFDSAAPTISSVTGRQYRRRAQTMAVNLRNYL